MTGRSANGDLPPGLPYPANATNRGHVQLHAWTARGMYRPPTSLGRVELSEASRRLTRSVDAPGHADGRALDHAGGSVAELRISGSRRSRMKKPGITHAPKRKVPTTPPR